MDEQMKTIAMDAYRRSSGGNATSLYAACEAVLAAEAQRREQAPVEKDRCVHGVDVSAACYQGLCYRPNPPVQTQSAPADDVVERMQAAYISGIDNDPEHVVCQTGDCCRVGMAAALAVAEPIITAKAREGYVPASEIAELKDEFLAMRIELGDTKQQLATMYTLEQVETAIRDEFNAYSYATSYLEGESRAFGVNVRTRLARLARLAAPKPEPTEQEKVACTCPKGAWVGSEPNDSMCELSEEEHQKANEQERNYHFEDEDVLEAVQNSEYAKDQIRRHLQFMTVDQKWSLYRAVVKIAALKGGK